MNDFSIKLKLNIRFKSHFVSLNATPVFIFVLFLLATCLCNTASADEYTYDIGDVLDKGWSWDSRVTVDPTEIARWGSPSQSWSDAMYAHQYMSTGGGMIRYTYDSVNDAGYLILEDDDSFWYGLTLNFQPILNTLGITDGSVTMDLGVAMLGYVPDGTVGYTNVAGGSSTYATSVDGNVYSTNVQSIGYHQQVSNNNLVYCNSVQGCWFGGRDLDYYNQCITDCQGSLTFASSVWGDEYCYALDRSWWQFGHIDGGTYDNDQSSYETWHNQVLVNSSPVSTGYTASTWSLSTLAGLRNGNNGSLYNYSTSSDCACYVRMTMYADAMIWNITCDVSWLASHDYKLTLIWGNDTYGVTLMKIYNRNPITIRTVDSTTVSSGSSDDYSDEIYSYLTNNSRYSSLYSLLSNWMSGWTSWLTSGFQLNETYNGTTTTDPNGTTYNNTNFLSMVRCMELILDEVNGNITDIENAVSVNGSISLNQQEILNSMGDVIDALSDFQSSLDSLVSSNADILQYTQTASSTLTSLRSDIANLQSATHSDLVAIKDAINNLQINVSTGDITVDDKGDWSVDGMSWITPIAYDSIQFTTVNADAKNFVKSESQWWYDNIPFFKYLFYFGTMSTVLIVIFHTWRKR